MYYLAVTILGMNEEEFWRSSPDKIFKLANIHNEVNSPNKKLKGVNEEKEVKKGKEIVTRGETMSFRKI